MSTSLEGSDRIPRSRAHTEYCIHAFALVELWDQYGIVGDLMVCQSYLLHLRGSERLMTAIYK